MHFWYLNIIMYFFCKSNKGHKLSHTIDQYYTLHGRLPQSTIIVANVVFLVSTDFGTSSSNSYV